MDLAEFQSSLQRQHSPLPVFNASVSVDQWRALPFQAKQAGGRLVALWGSERDGAAAICAAYASGSGLLAVELPLTDARNYPSLAAEFPAAVRMERAAADLNGIRPLDSDDARPWLNHGAWPVDWHPLRAAADPERRFPDSRLRDYDFVRVEGEGVHEIPVGPVHAGIIEPGHFRFSIVGERVLKLEQRLGYKHKGIEQRFQGMAADEGHRLAGRVSGDSTVAYAWAYCMALEAIREQTEPPRARWLRALMLERERVANHLGDLGALGNDAAFGFGLSQFMRLKEDWLRLNQRVFGHRMLMDRIVPGGVAVDVDVEARLAMREQCGAVAQEVRELRSIYDEHQGLQDRFVTTGRVTPQLAAELGLTGLAGRASSIVCDLRCDYEMAPYGDLGVAMASHRNGDVAARVHVRFEELLESLRLIGEICDRLPDGPIRSEAAAAAGSGIGWIEGWRGEVLVALEVDGDDRITRCHCHDPSWQNWPVLEHAVIGNIVPDFPLINKSFNLSYAGHDL
ncbi:MAG TPA: NADH-quinone oxidoreductase subunit C [Rhodocyclaceae bacterium]